MACWFEYQGNQYTPDQLVDVLRELPLDVASKYIPGVQSIPDAPFKSTWADLALKRAIAKAAQEGYDAISWTPGEQQAARYDLNKHYKEIGATRLPDGTYHITGKQANTRHDTHEGLANRVAEDKLADVVGKDLAEKIAAQKDNMRHDYSGVDLKVGGEGMKAFYDKMLVDKANALGKKYGAKVEWKGLPDSVNIGDRYGIREGLGSGWELFDKHTNKAVEGAPKFINGHEAESWLRKNGKYLTNVPVLKLTPQLKRQALKGLPLFAESGRAGAPLAGVHDQQDQRDVPGPEQQHPGEHQEDVTQRAAGGGVNTQPSEAQTNAGNYAKAHRWVQGLNITIENPKGSVRRGIDSNGKEWKAELPCAYGYIRGFGKAADGDHPDVFVGPHTNSPHVFIIDQIDLKTGKFDEHKAVLGAGSETQALNWYKAAFSDGKGQARIGAIHHLTMAEFKAWLEHGDLEQPFEEPETKKHTHASVNYTPHSTRPNKHCSNCRNYVPPELNGPACVGVKSPIDPAGWCNRFRPRSV